MSSSFRVGQQVTVNRTIFDEHEGVGISVLAKPGDDLIVRMIRPGHPYPISVSHESRRDGQMFMIQDGEIIELPSKTLNGRWYIAGPMSMYPGLNYELFHRYAKQYRKEGYEIVSPAELNPHAPKLLLTQTPEERTKYRHECLKRDIAQLLTCDGIIMLPEWHNSDGAQWEHDTAQKVGLTIRIAEPITLEV